MTALLKIVLLVALAGYAAVAALVWLRQESLLFYPQPVASAPRAPPGWRLESVRFTARDGTPLAGVLLLPPRAKPPLVVYFGGNAEEVTASAARVAETYGERAVLLVNYRGYGESGGKPGEQALIGDAVELLQWVARRDDVDGARIALHGRSLGSGVAVQAAAAHPVRCVVLTSPFDSAAEVARRFYPWLPVGLLMRHRFESIAHAPRLAMPLLVLTGSADTLVRPDHSERLASRWAGPVTRVSLAGFGHNDLDLPPRYAEAIRDFLGKHQ